jgi:demethylmenaquinone methyltransferase/2-methoxy-6-polyprenyl-1,4-benzoquinol methylase
MDELERYYARRAPVYDEAYLKPERQGDIAALKGELRAAFSGHDVLEVACGTGFWTEVLAGTAHSVTATDIADEMLNRARERSYPTGNVTFDTADAYSLTSIAGEFTAGFAGFWWSHVPRPLLSSFVTNFHRKIEPGGLVVFIDNTYVEGESHPIVDTDTDGNTYQRRTLKGRDEYVIVKNYPTEEELKELLGDITTELSYKKLTYYWHLGYRVV